MPQGIADSAKLIDTTEKQQGKNCLAPSRTFTIDATRPSEDNAASVLDRLLGFPALEYEGTLESHSSLVWSS